MGVAQNIQMNSKQLIKAKSDPLQRIYAKFVDAIIFIPIFGMSLFLINPEGPTLFVLFIINAIIVFILNVIIPYKTNGQSFGKSFVGLRIIQSNSRKGEFGTYFLRYSYTVLIGILAMIPVFGRPIAGFIGLIALILLFTDDNTQTLQDKYAKTYVVNDELHIRLQKTYKKMQKAKKLEKQKELKRINQ